MERPNEGREAGFGGKREGRIESHSLRPPGPSITILSACPAGDNTLRCPNEGREEHPKPGDNQFVMLALVYVGPNYGFKRMYEHFLEDVLCRVCGEKAREDDEEESRSRPA